MNTCASRWFLTGLICLGAAANIAPNAWAQRQAVQSAPALDTEEKEACKRNLKVIYDAIQAYQADHKDLPNWLSDLVPGYLSDANVLVCPVCRRTGQVEAEALADPKIPSSYIYEFSPAPLGAISTNAPGKTHREWKRRQMGLAGSIVPIVRCVHHDSILNLAFDGRILETQGSWETLVSNRVSIEDLTADRIFGEQTPGARSSGGMSEPASAAYERISLTNDVYSAALDSHDLDAGMKLVGKDATFKGTVFAVYDTRDGAMSILNFDPQYRLAMTALVRSENLPDFPGLKDLVGKNVLVSGKIIDYQGRPEIALTNSSQIKVAE